MVADNSTDNGQVSAVQTCFRIIEQLMERDGAGITELAADVGVAKSTVHDHLSTLRRDGYVIKENGEYKLSLRFLRIGKYVRTRKELYTMIEEEVREIAERTEQRTQFIAREGDHGIPLVYVSGKKGMPYIGFTIGEPLDLHATASGKAVFANLQKEHRDRLLQSDFKRHTDQTITDPAELRAELTQVREQGYAFNREESFEGLKAVGVPIQIDGCVLGSISVSGPSGKFHGEWFENELPRVLQEAKDEIELKLRHV